MVIPWQRKCHVETQNDETKVPTDLIRNRISHRTFLKGLGVAVGGLVSGAVLAPAHKAEATYIPGTPSDTVDTNLTVQGNLVVNQSTAVGTSTMQGRLNVAGDIWVNGTQAIGTDGVVKQSYYAP